MKYKKLSISLFLIVSIIHLYKNFRYLITYPEKFGMPNYVYEYKNFIESLDIYAYDFYLGPGMGSFNNGYPIDYIIIKLIVWIIIIIMILTFFFTKKKGYLKVSVAIMILPLVFFILSIWHLIKIRGELTNQYFPYIFSYQLINLSILLFSFLYLVRDFLKHPNLR